MQLSSHFWSDLTTRQFAQLAANKDIAQVVAVLPVAATEQHGPHLPVSVDTALVDGVVNALFAAFASRFTRFVSAHAANRQKQRAHSFSGHAHFVCANRYQPVDGHWRQRGAQWHQKNADFEQPRRPSQHHGHRGA